MLNFLRLDPDQAETLHPVSQKILQFTGGIEGEELDWREECTGTLNRNTPLQSALPIITQLIQIRFVQISDSDNNSK